jgi:flagellar biosynthesis regulator FlbT
MKKDMENNFMDKKIYLSIIDIVHLGNFIETSEWHEALKLIREKLPLDRRIAREE